MQPWEKVYKEKGRYFLKPHESIPEIARMFKKMRVKRVLDLGSGSGRHVVYLSKMGFDVYGFDSSKTGMALAKKWLRKEHLRAHLKVYDMNKGLPYGDSFFDAAIATSTLHHNRPEGVKRTISELERVLAKGGILFFTVPRWRQKLHKGEKWQMEKIADRTYLPLDGIEKGLPHFFFDKKTIVKFLHNFKIVRLKFVKTHYNVIAIKK
jgi:SAM-dependent methyltransferase